MISPLYLLEEEKHIYYNQPQVEQIIIMVRVAQKNVYTAALYAVSTMQRGDEVWKLCPKRSGQGKTTSHCY